MLNSRPVLGSAIPTTTTLPTSGGGPVPAVARAARVLDALAHCRQPLSLAALVRSLALPKSTVHGLCATLALAGLVERLDDGTYQLGTRVLDLAHAYMARTDLTAVFQSLTGTGNPLPEESIVLSVLDGPDIVYVGCRHGTRAFGFQFRIGMRLPANCAASGKAIMSTLPAESVTELALSGAFVPLTRKSVTRAAPLLVQLQQARRLGYAIDDEETRRGMVCIGAPVFGPGSTRAVAGVAVSMPKPALTPQRRELAIDAVRQLAEAITRRLGGHWVEPDQGSPRSGLRLQGSRRSGTRGALASAGQPP